MNNANSSNARKIYTEDYSFNAIDPKYERQLQEAPEFAVLKELKIKRNNKKVKTALIVKVSIVFILGLITVFRFASITELGYKVHDVRIQYNNLKTENSRMEVNIAKHMNLSEISEIASNRLGMQKPQSFQVVHVSVTPTDQTEVMNLKFTKDKSENPWYINVLNDIKSFLGIC